MKELNVRRNDTLRDLVVKIEEEFGIKDIPLMNIRLRNYDPKL
jgi:hypothetical protein